MKKIMKICMIALMLIINVACTDNSGNNSNNGNEVMQIGVTEILDNPDKYENQKIYVEGRLPIQLILDTDGELIPVILDLDNDNYIKITGNTPTAGGCDAIVLGIIRIEKDKPVLEAIEYKTGESAYLKLDESNDSSLNNTSVFAKMREAAINYSSLNWNQLMMNPTSLSGMYVYIPGEVLDIDVENGVTSGLIDTQGNGNASDLVSFIIYEEVYDISVGDIIAPMGNIAPTEGSAYNGATGQTYDTPLIEVINPILYKTEYYLDLNDDEIHEFLYGTYVAEDYDYDLNLGETFIFAESSIGEYSYSFQDTAYLNPAIKIGSGSLFRGYDDIRIGMNLVADGIGSQVSVNSDLRVTSFSVDLKDGRALVNSDGYRHNYYKK